jgi:hypothetical protein
MIEYCEGRSSMIVDDECEAYNSVQSFLHVVSDLALVMVVLG